MPTTISYRINHNANVSLRVHQHIITAKQYQYVVQLLHNICNSLKQHMPRYTLCNVFTDDINICVQRNIDNAVISCLFFCHVLDVFQQHVRRLNFLSYNVEFVYIIFNFY